MAAAGRWGTLTAIAFCSVGASSVVEALSVIAFFVGDLRICSCCEVFGDTACLSLDLLVSSADVVAVGAFCFVS